MLHCSTAAPARARFQNLGLPIALALLGSLLSSPAAFAQGSYCTCRLYPVASFGTFFIYLAETRDSCVSPGGGGSCSPPTLFLMSAAPGLPPQSCSAGECVTENLLAAQQGGASTESDWALTGPYPSNFSFETISSSDAAHFAVFPGRGRPTKAVQQDFTLLGGEGGVDVHVRTFKAERTVRYTGSDQKKQSDRVIVYAVGAEFIDQDLADNIVIPYEDHWGAEGRDHCLCFMHQYAGDDGGTDHMVLTVDPDLYLADGGSSDHVVLAVGPQVLQR